MLNRCIISICSSILLIGSLSGCTPRIPLSPQARESVHTVNVDPVINMPSVMTYNQSGAKMAYVLGGIIGLAIEGDIAGKRSREILEEQKRIHLSLDEMLVTEFKHQIQSSGVFLINNKNPDAVVTLKVDQYGFNTTKMGFSTMLVPVLTLEAQLIYHGRPIWKDYVDTRSIKSPAFSLDAIRKNPALLKQIWGTTFQKIVQTLILKLKCGKC